jgi:hypothetical protein
MLRTIKMMTRIITVPVGIASLCCMAPAVLVTLGIGTTSFATSLADSWYGTYKWLFRGIGLIALAISIVLYLRNTHGICSLDQAKRQKNVVINIVSLIVLSAIALYIVWLYVIVHYWGVWLNIW